MLKPLIDPMLNLMVRRIQIPNKIPIYVYYISIIHVGVHVIIVAGILRYLAGRFPETTTVVDENGRTALHYAAVLKDNGHFFNLLVNFGANPKAKDKVVQVHATILLFEFIFDFFWIFVNAACVIVDQMS